MASHIDLPALQRQLERSQNECALSSLVRGAAPSWSRLLEGSGFELQLLLFRQSLFSRISANSPALMRIAACLAGALCCVL